MKYLVDLLAKVSCSRYMWLFKFLALAYTHGELENISCENWGFDLVLEENPDGYFSRTERVAVEEFIRIRCKMPNLFRLSDELLPLNPDRAIIALYEIVNIYILYSVNVEEIKDHTSPIKIVLLQARADPYGHVPGHLPIGLLTLAACAQDRQYQAKLFARMQLLPDSFEDFLAIWFEFKVLDFQTKDPDFNFSTYLQEYQPTIVGIRTVSVCIDEADKLARIVRNTLGDTVKILYGGYHVTALPEKTLLDNKAVVDIGVLGEAEETFPHLLLSLFTSALPNDAIPGICYWDASGKYIKTVDRIQVMELDDYPSFLEQLDLLHLDSYREIKLSTVHGEIKSKIALLVSSRGCLVDCTFCPTHTLWRGSRKIRFDSAACVLDKMNQYYERGYRVFYFRDDNFTTNQRRIEDICRGIIERGWKIGWYCMSRVDTVDRSLLGLMQQAGLSAIAFGVESGDEQVIAKMHKNIRIWNVRYTSRMCRELGLLFKLYFMVGYPEESWTSVLRSMLLIIDSLVGFKNWERFVPDSDDRLALKKIRKMKDEYRSAVEALCLGFISGTTDLHEYLSENLELSAYHKIYGLINVSYATPYPGSDLYKSIGQDIYMMQEQFRHGPPENANLEVYLSPIETNEMKQDEITMARDAIIFLCDAILKFDTEAIEEMLRKVITEIKRRQIKTNLLV